MQKISSYLYPNRIQLLVNVAGFTTEYTNVYQRTIKIYNGVDNVLEFDIKNADQKRIDLSTVSQLEMNVMDSQGNALPNSPYAITRYKSNTITPTGMTTSGNTATITFATQNTIPFYAGTLIILAGFGAPSGSNTATSINSTYTVVSGTTGNVVVTLNGTYTPSSLGTVSVTIKGLGQVIIPGDDLSELDHQFLRYSVTCLKDGIDTMLYADSKFGAVGTIELVGNAMPTFRAEHVYDRFQGEIDFAGNVINHTSAIPAKFYEAVKTETIDFDIAMTAYKGSIYLEGTKDSTISVESFKNAAKLQTFTTTVATSTTTSFSILVGDFNYFRISWTYMDPVLIGVNSVYPTGTVDKVTVN